MRNWRASPKGKEYARAYRTKYIKTPEGRAKIRAQRAKERGAIRRARVLKYAYGITVEKYEAMVAAQNGKCAICGKRAHENVGGKLHVDHCHRTNQVRGLLCNDCNHGLGQFRDNTQFLISAVIYLNGMAGRG